jgi:hypothetical protein
MGQPQIQWDAAPDTSALTQQSAPNQSQSPTQGAPGGIQWDDKRDTSSLAGASSAEQADLQKNPTHIYVKADPKFPNRPEGIYPTGPGNEWRNDPNYSQSPIDPELLKHSIQYGVGAAAAAGSAALPGAAAAAFPSVLPHTIEGVKAIGQWANKNPFTAWMIFNALKEYIPGAKKAIGFIEGAPGASE